MVEFSCNDILLMWGIQTKNLQYHVVENYSLVEDRQICSFLDILSVPLIQT